MFDHLKRNGQWYLLLVLMLVGVFVFYWLRWHTFTDFVYAIDHNPGFMQDFVRYYYETGRQILQSSKPVDGYFYTSFFAILLSPISTLPIPAATFIWTTIQLTCLIIFCVVSSRILKMPPLQTVLFAGLCVTSFPILHNLRWGQVSLLITVCVMIAFFIWERNKPSLAAILLAFVSAIKFYPAIFGVHFLLKRDTRSFVIFVLALFVFFFAIPATVLGFSNWLGFEKTILTAIRNSDWVTYDVNSQYVVHVARRWFEFVYDRAPDHWFTRILSITGYAIGLSCVFMAWLLYRREALEDTVYRWLPSFYRFLSYSKLHGRTTLYICRSARQHYCTAMLHFSGLQSYLVRFFVCFLFYQ